MRRPRKSINQINVVPYIDVMLVLLVIFMITAPLINPGEIELPSVLLARIRDRQAKNPEQAVVIYADGDVPYKAVMGVLDMLQTNNVRKVGLMARPQS